MVVSTRSCELIYTSQIRKKSLRNFLKAGFDDLRTTLFRVSVLIRTRDTSQDLQSFLYIRKVAEVSLEFIIQGMKTAV